MEKATLATDRHFKIAVSDKRLCGSFLEHWGRAVYGGVYEPGSRLSDERGFRLDTAAAVRDLGVSVVRYPGGNIVSAYRWEDGIGPKENRPVRLEPAWQNLEDNSFGTDEFMDWAKLAGISPMMAVNLGTRGAAEAAALLEYCNHPSGTYYSDLRIKNGHKEPYKVKLWCLGNEMDGTWQIGHKSAAEYGSLAAQTAKLMKLIDPEIELAVCGSAGINTSTYGRWDEEVLEHCYDLTDYLSVHAYFNNANRTEEDSAAFIGGNIAFGEHLDGNIAICDCVRAKLKKKKRIHLSVDEWNVVYRPHGKPGGERWTKAPVQVEDVYRLEDALLVGSLLITMLNRADRIKIGCLAQLVNTVAPIMTSPLSSWKQTIYFPFADVSRVLGNTVLLSRVSCSSYETKKCGPVPKLDCAVIDSEENESLTILAVNKDLHESVELCSDLRQFKDYRPASHSVLTGELRDANTENNPLCIKPEAGEGAKLSQGRLSVILPPRSWNVITLKKEKDKR